MKKKIIALFLILVLFEKNTTYSMNKACLLNKNHKFDVQKHFPPIENDFVIHELIARIQNNEATIFDIDEALQIIYSHTYINYSDSMHRQLLLLFTTLMDHAFKAITTAPYVNDMRWLTNFIKIASRYPDENKVHIATLTLIIEVILKENQSIHEYNQNAFSSDFLTTINLYGLQSLQSPSKQTQELGKTLFSSLMNLFKKTISQSPNDHESIDLIEKNLLDIFNPTRTEYFYTYPYPIEYPNTIKLMALDAIDFIVKIPHSPTDCYFYNFATAINLLQKIMFSRNHPKIKEVAALIIEEALDQINHDLNEEHLEDYTLHTLSIIVQIFVSYSNKSIDTLCNIIVKTTIFFKLDDKITYEILEALLRRSNLLPLSIETSTNLMNTLIHIVNMSDLDQSETIENHSSLCIICLKIIQALIDHGHQEFFETAEELAIKLFTNKNHPEIDAQIAWLLHALVKKNQALATAQEIVLKNQHVFNQNNPSCYAWVQLKRLLQEKGFSDFNQLN